MLAGLPVEPRRRVGVHAPSPAAGRLVDGGRDAGILKRQRRVQTRDAAADNRHARGPCCPRGGGRERAQRSAERGRANRCSTGLEEAAAGQAHLPSFLLYGLQASTRPLGLIEILEEGLELSQQWGARHDSSSSWMLGPYSPTRRARCASPATSPRGGEANPGMPTRSATLCW